MTRVEKRASIIAALKEDANRSDRATARQVGVSHVTVAEARKKLTTGQIENDRGLFLAKNGQPKLTTGQIETVHTPPAGTCAVCGEIEFLHDPAKRTVKAVVDWLLETLPDAPVDRICAALQRRRAAAGENEIVINWEAGKAARDLARIWSTARLDEFREHLAAGKPTRMTETEKLVLWGADKAPKQIGVPDDPARASEKLWLWWGAFPAKLHRLVSEIARRTNAPPPPMPKYDPEEADIPF
jgi:hypothetical protein